MEAPHIGVPVGRLDVKILVGHLAQQIVDVVDDGVQTRHHGGGGAGQFRRFVPAGGLGGGGLQVALHQLLHPLGASPHGNADVAGELQGHHNGGQNGHQDHQHADEDAKICIRQIVGLGRGHGQTPAVGSAHRGVGQETGAVFRFDGAKTVSALTHGRVEVGPAFQRGIVLGLPLDILGGDGIQRNIGNGVAGFVNHVGPAVVPDLDGGDNVVQEGLRGYEIDHAHDTGLTAPVRIEGRGHHNGQLSCDFTDERLGDIDISRHGLTDILPVGVVLSIENADAFRSDDIAPLETVKGHALVDNRALFLQRSVIVRQLRDAAGVYGHVLVGSQLLLNTLRRQHRCLTHHLVYGGDSAPVAQSAAGRSHRDQCDQDGCHQTYCDFFTNAVHLFPPQYDCAEAIFLLTGAYAHYRAGKVILSIDFLNESD